HTRFSRDWSSDVCSSDLEINLGLLKTRLPSGEALAFDRLANEETVHRHGLGLHFRYLPIDQVTVAQVLIAGFAGSVEVDVDTGLPLDPFQLRPSSILASDMHNTGLPRQLKAFLAEIDHAQLVGVVFTFARRLAVE